HHRCTAAVVARVDGQGAGVVLGDGDVEPVRTGVTQRVGGDLLHGTPDGERHVLAGRLGHVDLQTDGEAGQLTEELAQRVGELLRLVAQGAHGVAHLGEQPLGDVPRAGDVEGAVPRAAVPRDL